MIIKIILILAVLSTASYFLSHRSRAASKAWVKLGFVGFILCAIYAVIRPDDLTVVAQAVGVNRGSDLLLYGLCVVFAFTTLSAYLRLREQETRYTKLARFIALGQARKPSNETDHSQ